MYGIGYANPVASAETGDDGRVKVTVSVTIDNIKGEYGSFEVDKVTAAGTGCRGENADLLHPEDCSVDKNYYILKESGDEYIYQEDLQYLGNGISDEEFARILMLARNEIYARHGRKFKDDEIREYFESQAWYAGIIDPGSFDESVLSDVESENIKTIKNYEEMLEESEVEYTDSDEYIIPYSDEYVIDEGTLAGMTEDELMYARNEIYARHGRKFNDEDIQNYFNSKSWYYGYIEPDEFTDDVFNEVEKENIKIIKEYEARYE